MNTPQRVLAKTAKTDPPYLDNMARSAETKNALAEVARSTKNVMDPDNKNFLCHSAAFRSIYPPSKPYWASRRSLLM